jgi:hypothetical protein
MLCCGKARPIVNGDAWWEQSVRFRVGNWPNRTSIFGPVWPFADSLLWS